MNHKAVLEGVAHGVRPLNPQRVDPEGRVRGPHLRLELRMATD